MKLQIDAIVTKSEALKSESCSEQYNRQLTDNGACANLPLQRLSLILVKGDSNWKRPFAVSAHHRE